MLYLIFSILSSVLIANLLMVFNRRQSRDILSIFLGNYLTASLFSLLSGKVAVNSINLWDLSFAILCGALFLGNFFVYHKNIGMNGMSISVGVMRMAVVIPIMFSLLIFHESLRLSAIMGVIITLAAFTMLTEKQNKTNLLWIIGLFIITGVTDSTLKVYDVFGRGGESAFLALLFGSAFVFTLLWIIIGGRRFDKTAIAYGLLLGVPNQLSSLFFLRALSSVKAGIAYPVVASGIVILGILSDLLFWKRTFSIKQLFALVFLALGIVLLNLS